MTHSPGDRYQFGDVVLDVLNLRLTVSGAPRPLEPKSFHLLQFLIENRNRVVPKDEILRVVWDGAAVSDNALTRAVAQIRKALDDDPRQPRFIETVPTLGYRFAGQLIDQPDALPPAPLHASPLRKFPSRWVVPGAIAILVIVSGSLWLARRLRTFGRRFRPTGARSRSVRTGAANTKFMCDRSLRTERNARSLLTGRRTSNLRGVPTGDTLFTSPGSMVGSKLFLYLEARRGISAMPATRRNGRRTAAL
jgi:DNA-binding winged helix-turn-helix (wHTH) protein